MFPLRDDNPTARFPILTLVLILLNALVFVYEWTLPPGSREFFIRQHALIPAELGGGAPGGWIHLFTSQFLHAGPMHLGGNMLYLWIFGNNIEDTLGRLRFLPFYLGCGAAAGLVHAAAAPSSTVPTIGASGAVAGVLGAYALLFPRAKVYTLVILFVFLRVFPLPAALWLGIWLAFQILSAVGSRAMEGGGVAWFAHLGGFAVGFLLIKLVSPRRRREPDGLFESRSWVR
jgi:membrane associated rhomboid family serine protease